MSVEFDDDTLPRANRNVKRASVLARLLMWTNRASKSEGARRILLLIVFFLLGIFAFMFLNSEEVSRVQGPILSLRSP